MQSALQPKLWGGEGHFNFHVKQCDMHAVIVVNTHADTSGTQCILTTHHTAPRQAKLTQSSHNSFGRTTSASPTGDCLIHSNEACTDRSICLSSVFPSDMKLSAAVKWFMEQHNASCPCETLPCARQGCCPKWSSAASKTGCCAIKSFHKLAVDSLHHVRLMVESVERDGPVTQAFQSVELNAAG